MSNIDTIRKQLADTAHYHGLSYAAIVGVASEIEAVTDKQARAALRREFRELHGLTSVVWARVDKRFSVYNDTPAQAIRAMAYCCQLPLNECMDMWQDHHSHILEPGALHLVLRDVNDALDARRNGHEHAAKRATKDKTAEDCADLVIYWRRREPELSPAVSETWIAAADNLAAVDGVAVELARRQAEKGEK